jgi:hypothetical protein
VSAVADEQTPGRRRSIPRGRAGAVAGVLLLAGAAYGLSSHHVGGLGASSDAGSHGAPGSAASGGGSGGGGGGGVSGSSNGGPAAGNNGAATAVPSAGTHGSPTPARTLAPMPTHSGITGTGNWNQSNCAGTFEPGDSCTVAYSGEYFLLGTQPQTVVVQARAKDGRVLATQSYAAPAGGHRYGAVLTFAVPKDVREIDMLADLKDATGAILAETLVQEKYAA